MDIFQTVKQNVTIEAVAERYGLHISRGKALCPFHNDTHPSLYIHKTFYHCFVCDAGGDQISFVSNLFDIPPLKAAEIICKDFGLPYHGSKNTVYQIAAKGRDIERRKMAAEWERQTSVKVIRAFRELNKVLQDHVGLYETDDLILALSLYSRAGYFASIFETGTKEEREELYQKHREEIDQIVTSTNTIA